MLGQHKKRALGKRLAKQHARAQLTRRANTIDPRPPRKRVQRKGVCTISEMDRPAAAVGMYCRFTGAAQQRPLRV